MVTRRKGLEESGVIEGTHGALQPNKNKGMHQLHDPVEPLVHGGLFLGRKGTENMVYLTASTEVGANPKP